MWGAVAQIFLPAPVARPPARAGSSITTGRSPASSGRVGLAGCPAPVGSRFRRAGRPARSRHARCDRGVFLPAPVARPPAPAGSSITTGCWPASSGRVLLVGSSAPVGSRFRRAGRPARSLRARRDCGVFLPALVARPPAPAGSSITTGCWPASSGRVLLAGCPAPGGSRFRAGAVQLHFAQGGGNHNGVEPTMSDATQKSARTPRDLDREIERAQAKLKKLEQERREQARKAAERNERAILDCLREAKLLELPAETWQGKITDITRLLSAAPSAEQGAGQPTRNG
ncbi:hypothetical protein B7760_05794 (plasmid) [Burkholderia glumae]|nr:hypothetical protein B7760_05794 [Burkholderia glumae]